MQNLKVVNNTVTIPGSFSIWIDGGKYFIKIYSSQCSTITSAQHDTTFYIKKDSDLFTLFKDHIFNYCNLFDFRPLFLCDAYFSIRMITENISTKRIQNDNGTVFGISADRTANGQEELIYCAAEKFIEAVKKRVQLLI